MLKKYSMFYWICNKKVQIEIFLGKCSKKDSKLYKMVYQDFTEDDFDYCFSMFNKTHTIGCQCKQVINNK